MEFQREAILLQEQPLDKHLVYFSSLSIYYANTAYAAHKADMERIIKFDFPSYTIVRLGNITWGGNPHTVIGYLRQCVREDVLPVIHDACRIVIDLDRFKELLLNVTRLTPYEVNASGDRISIREMYDRIKKGDL